MGDEKGQENQTPQCKFQFYYREDPVYLSSPSHEAIERLNLRQIFETESAKAIKDLEIDKQLTISVIVPADIKNSNIIDSLGIGAWTFSNDKASGVIFQLDPNHLDIVANISKWQGRIIAHEFNHLARCSFSGETLIDALVFEGLAVNYEENWGGKYQKSPWGNALKPKQLKIEWQKAQKELDSTLTLDNYRDWFFGTSHGHPRWTGYALGAEIVRHYLKSNPSEPMREVVHKPSREILLENFKP